ncbi:AAA family ATPase [Capnocytophaga sputigena]|uniref:McrB family protein n=1 Tax=Capnocytophaga sputigena TaxID=1019 RepID=UPI0028F00132|nr:AAA family ATPase [Capnocytophaga sputigena]
MENKELYQLRDEFLSTWPLERMKEMAIDEYTNLNKDDSFCYWLEKKTKKLGSIGGGSSFKFGIYKRRNTDREFEKNAISDGEYAWLDKYGKERDEAFNNVKNIIIDIIKKSQAGDFKAIDSIDLGNAIKWKIAHLYSDNRILNVFSKEKLIEIAKKLSIEFEKKISFYNLQDLVLKQKSPEEDYFTFAKRIWSLTANKEAKYWLYSPGEQAVKWEEFYNEGIMAIGWDKLENLENYTDRKSILEALRNNYGGREKQPNWVSAIDDFCNGENKINVGDIVIAKKGTKTLLGYGEITSDYYFDDKRAAYKHCRKVKWVKKGEWDVDDNLPRKTLTDTTLEKARYLLNIMNENTNKQENNHMIELLKYKPQIILQGPPGTGKTREAKRIAKALLDLGENDSLEGNEQFKLIQFHPSYSYEDFVRGIIAENTDGNISYVTKDKILAEFAKKALKDKDTPYVLIIDEINRANLSSVLGELIYALEYRGEAVQSMYAIEGENNLILPPNLYIIGTMNTADRSVGHIDYAIRRRFAFVNILPKELEKDFHKELFRAVSELFISNYDEYISNPDIELKRALTLSSEFKPEDVWLGHSYFITKNTPIDIRWEYEIKPILFEYVKDGILVGEGIETTINNLINNENNAS